MQKLVRDKIPDIIRANGQEAVVRILGEAEYLSALGAKAVEEAGELSEAIEAGNRVQALEELADLQEVVLATRASLGATPEELEYVRRQKLEERGGFDDRIWLEEVK